MPGVLNYSYQTNGLIGSITTLTPLLEYYRLDKSRYKVVGPKSKRDYFADNSILLGISCVNLPNSILTAIFFFSCKAFFFQTLFLKDFFRYSFRTHTQEFIFTLLEV